MNIMITEKSPRAHAPMAECTLVIPTHNDASMIGEILTRLCDALTREKSTDFTIVVADNASIDKTRDAVEQFDNKHVKLFHLNGEGEGDVIRTAFARTEGDSVGFVNAGALVSPQEIIAAVKLLKNNEADVVVGTLASSKNSMLHFFARIILDLRAIETGCPFMFMNARGLELMLATKENTRFFDLEFLTLGERLKLRVKKIPVTLDKRWHQKGKHMSWNITQAIFAMLRIKKRLPVQISLLEQRMVK